MGGETVRDRQRRVVGRGLSPRGRGNRPPPGHRRVRPGSIPAWAGKPPSAGLEVQAAGDLGDSVRRALGAADAVHGTGDADPQPIPVRQDEKLRLPSVFRKVERQQGTQPVAIVLRERGNAYPELLAAHELGHFLDLAALPGAHQQSQLQTMPAMQELLRVIRDTGTWRDLLAGYAAAATLQERSAWSYYLRPQELFARVYAQWIAWKSGDRRMLDQLDARSAVDGADARAARIRLSQWPLEEFLPIAQAMDRLALQAGWLRNDG